MLSSRPCDPPDDGAGAGATICYSSPAVGLILDLAVVAIAVVVVGSLAVLTWTLAVTAVRSVHRERRRVETARRQVTDTEASLTDAAARATASLEYWNRRTGPSSASVGGPIATAGEQPDA